MLELDYDIVENSIFHSLFGEGQFTQKNYTLFTLFADAITLIAEDFEPVWLYLLIHYLGDTYEVALDRKTSKPISTVLGIRATPELYLEVNTTTKEILSYISGEKAYYLVLPEALTDNLSRVFHWAWELEESLGVLDYLWVTETHLAVGFQNRFAPEAG